MTWSVLRSIFVLLLFGFRSDTTRGAENPTPKKEGLYSPLDDVIILNADNMKERVHGKSKVWMIEYYNSWCGHCINFAPTFKSFAKDLLGWRRVVSVGAIDCANEKNVPLCREQDIQAYPSLKLFPPYFNGTVTSSIKTLTTQEKVEMKDAVLDFITDPEFSIPPSWPRLEPIKDIAHILEQVTEEHKFVVLVFEEEQSIVGKEVILDLVDYPSLLVRTMRKADVQKFGVLKYPSLYIINKDSSFKHLASGTGMVDSDRHRFVDTLLNLIGMFDHSGKRIRVGAQEEGAKVPADQSHQDQVHTDRPLGKSSSSGVHMQDLESALHYSLRQEVAICKTIGDEKLEDLRKFIRVLAKYFPGREEVTQFLSQLAEELSKLEKPLTGESWMELIDSLQGKESFLPERIRWTGCRGSHPRYRGFPCSMWTLFHTLTVAAHIDPKPADGLEVLLAIKGYMKHFFGCHECSQNFLKMADSLEHEIHEPMDAVMWLWSAHNTANKRLHGDTSEDPKHPKIQFPSVRDCPQCHAERKSGARIDPDQHPSWNMSAVQQFLVRFYSKNSIIRDESDASSPPSAEHGQTASKEMDWWEKKQEEIDLKKLRGFRKQKEKRQQEKQSRLVPAEAQKDDVLRFQAESPVSLLEDRGGQGRELKGGWSWLFSDVDIGVCMAFYVCCAVIILFLYYHFLVQRRYRLPCSKYLPV